MRGGVIMATKSNIKDYKDRFSSPMGGKFNPPKKTKKSGGKKNGKR